ncbi:hypothetical protein D3C80_1227290 [compost metagenome]
MRIAQRQKRQNAVIMENLTRYAAVRLSGTNRRDHRVMTVIPKRQWDIRFISQPGVRTISANNQTRR